jgi:hypothetical protein
VFIGTWIQSVKRSLMIEIFFWILIAVIVGAKVMV